MKYVFPLSVAVFPVITFAAADLGSLLGKFYGIVEALIPIIIGLAVLAFIWGILKYVVAKGEEDRKEARNVMIYGIIVIFVMVSVWGLVNLLGETIGLDNSNVPTAPRLPH